MSLGTTSHPTGPCTTQQARNLLTDRDERAAAVRFLVRGADQFTTAFDTCWLSRSTSSRSHRGARANCLAERLELTAATELTDRILIFGETAHRTLQLIRHARSYRLGLDRPRIRRRPMLGGPRASTVSAPPS
jgi:hypothetical protein